MASELARLFESRPSTSVPVKKEAERCKAERSYEQHNVVPYIFLPYSFILLTADGSSIIPSLHRTTLLSRQEEDVLCGEIMGIGKEW